MRRLWVFSVILLLGAAVPAQNCPSGSVGDNCRAQQEKNRQEEESRARQEREAAERKRQEQEQRRQQEDKARQEWHNHCQVQKDDARCYQ